MPKVLIADKMSPRAAEIFKNRGVDVDVKTGLDPEELKKIINDYDGLAIRSSTKVTADILSVAKKLKVVGRAGIGVDNVDIPAASENGVVVMNTPFGNSVTTAEHTIAMMFALARKIPQADASTKASKWEKSKFMGAELFDKTLGVVGCGNIGSIVINRALGLKMKVIGYDPFLTEERASNMGIKKVELDELLQDADFITVHTPLTDKTRNIIDEAALKKTKPGVRIINCARGGLVNEKALKAALESGHVAGAALDVFEEEPAKDNPLFEFENVVVTPHLGASTQEAQENVALQVAEQISDYLLSGAIVNAINVPSVSETDAPKLKPYSQLAENLGSLVGQLVQSGTKKVTITYEGAVAKLNTKPLTASLLAGLLQPVLETVNVVSAPVFAKDRGIDVSEVLNEESKDYYTAIRINIETENRQRMFAGTLTSNNQPRIIEVDGVPIDAAFGENVVYFENVDKPGFIGRIGQMLGDANINIATFNLGRSAPNEKVISLLNVDTEVSNDVLEALQGLDNVVQAKRLKFAV